MSYVVNLGARQRGAAAHLGCLSRSKLSCVVAGRRVLKKEQPVLGGFSKEQYRSLRLWAQSEGGVQVPVSLVHKKGVVRLDGSDPLLLYAYGAYGAAQDAEFDAERLSLLDR